MAPREVALAAYDVHDRLAEDPAADMSRLATHRRGGFLGGDVVPVGEGGSPPLVDEVSAEAAPVRVTLAGFEGRTR